jgi:ribosomal protein S14
MTDLPQNGILRKPIRELSRQNIRKMAKIEVNEHSFRSF